MSDTLAEQLAEVERLKSAMLKKIYYVMNRRVVAPDRLGPAMLAHYRWIIGLEKAGVVVASGPLFERDGAQGVGMTVFRAASFEEAEVLARSDPFCIQGAAEFDLTRWQINEGRIEITIDFSDQSFGFS